MLILGALPGLSQLGTSDDEDSMFKHVTLVFNIRDAKGFSVASGSSG